LPFIASARSGRSHSLGQPTSAAPCERRRCRADRSSDQAIGSCFVAAPSALASPMLRARSVVTGTGTGTICRPWMRLRLCTARRPSPAGFQENPAGPVQLDPRRVDQRRGLVRQDEIGSATATTVGSAAGRVIASRRLVRPTGVGAHCTRLATRIRPRRQPVCSPSWGRRRSTVRDANAGDAFSHRAPHDRAHPPGARVRRYARRDDKRYFSWRCFNGAGSRRLSRRSVKNARSQGSFSSQ
jgi:hypothetical protein